MPAAPSSRRRSPLALMEWYDGRLPPFDTGCDNADADSGALPANDTAATLNAAAVSASGAVLRRAAGKPAADCLVDGMPAPAHGAESSSGDAALAESLLGAVGSNPAAYVLR